MRVYSLRSRRSPLAPLRSPQSPKSRKPPKKSAMPSTQTSRKPSRRRSGSGSTIRAPHLSVGDPVDPNLGKYTLDNLPLFRCGKLPSEVIKQVEKLVKYIGSKVPIGQRSSWLKGHLEDAHLNHIGFGDVFERPDRAKETEVLKEMELQHPSPSDFEKTYKALLPKLPKCETPQIRALKMLDMYSRTGWMMDKAWAYLEDNFNVVNGGCWIAKKTACEDYPYGFRSKDRPRLHVTVSTTFSVQIPKLY